jgi:hypothetical protein
VLDEGTKALNGKWNYSTGVWDLLPVRPGVNPDPQNPSHFIRFKDRNGENAKVILDGEGRPVSPESRDLVFSCPNSCTDRGLPKHWRVVGPYASVMLAYQSGCQWSSLGTAERSMTLLWIPGPVFAQDDSWQLTDNQSGDVYELLDSAWNCYGPNVMPAITANPFGKGTKPFQAVLTAGANPGSIPVSVYPEGDFLLLGIPTVL